MVHSNIYEDKQETLSGFSRNITIAFTAIALASSGAAFFSIWDAILNRQLPPILSLGAILLILRVSGIVIADYIGSSCFRHYDELVTEKQRKDASNLLGAYIGISALNLVVSLVLEAIYHNPEIRFPDGTFGAIQIWTFAGMPLQGVIMLIMGVGLRESDPAYKRLQAEKMREDIATQAAFSQKHQQRMAELSRQSTEIDAQAAYYASNSYKAVVMRATQLKLLRQLETDPHVSADDIAFLQDAIPQLKGRSAVVTPPLQLPESTTEHTDAWTIKIGRDEIGQVENYEPACQLAQQLANQRREIVLVMRGTAIHASYAPEIAAPEPKREIWTLDRLLAHWDVSAEKVTDALKTQGVKSADEAYTLLKRYGRIAGYPLPADVTRQQFNHLYAKLEERAAKSADDVIILPQPNGAGGVDFLGANGGV